MLKNKMAREESRQLHTPQGSHAPAEHRKTILSDQPFELLVCAEEVHLHFLAGYS